VIAAPFVTCLTESGMPQQAFASMVDSADAETAKSQMAKKKNDNRVFKTIDFILQACI
jgi:hypothetical protein